MRIATLLGLTLIIAMPIPALRATPPATAAPAASPQTDMAVFARGTKAWADNCARCHSMHDPKENSDRQWKVVTTHMRLRAGLDGQQARDITAFLQASNNMDGAPPLTAPLVMGTAETAVVADGKALYEATCSACHGANAQGAIPGVPNLAGRLAKPDAELVANILNGFQSKGSPMAMPAKGGNSNLTAADAQALVVYMRALTGTSK